MNPDILYEDDWILVCKKPAGMATQTRCVSQMDLNSWLLAYLKRTKQNPYIGMVHRLDQWVGGILIFGKTKEMAGKLQDQLKTGKLKKTYLAVVEKDLKNELGKEPKKLTDYIKKDTQKNYSYVCSTIEKNAKKACLFYQVKQVISIQQEGKSYDLSLLEIKLQTGRHHQIRVQLSSRGMMLWGDQKYRIEKNQKDDADKKQTPIALYAYQLEIEHPKTRKQMCFTAQPTTDPFCRFC